jgi:pilus assembly protein Flp/PilA
MGDRGSRDERGATAVEYGLMLALIAGVIAVAVATLGTHVLAAFTQMSSTWP